jgi:hypothetical protein
MHKVPLILGVGQTPSSGEGDAPVGGHLAGLDCERRAEAKGVRERLRSGRGLLALFVVAGLVALVTTGVLAPGRYAE